MYSDMSTRISAFSSPNRYSASARASSVLPTPVGPRKTNEPTGRLASLRPARERRMARATALTASSWPMIRPWSASSMRASFGRFLLLELGQRDAGPAGDDELDVLLADRLHALALVPLPLALQLLLAMRRTFSFSRSEAAFSNSCASRYMSFSRMHPLQLLLDLLELGGRRERHEARAGRGLVDDVDRLVGELAVRDVAVGQRAPRR